MMWLKYRATDIPPQLKYPEYEKHKDARGYTLMYYWIVYRLTDIPEDLIY